MEKVVGNALRKERESRGVTLADISRETRIGTRFLQALEEETFDLFPGAFYIHYYIKSYLKACGADETTFFNTYQEYLRSALRRADELPPDQYMHKMNYARFRRRRTLLAALLALALLALLAWLLLGPPRWLDKSLAWRPAPAPDIPPFSEHLELAEERACPTRAPLEARLDLDAPCWLSLWRGSEKVAERTFRPGESVALTGYRLTLVIASPAALRLRLNGREVRSLRRSGEAVKLVVDPLSLADVLRR
jgi:transcriptional regulator with XRE-family HTH domain